MKLKWYHYVAVFFAGVFLVNAIPHFIHGVSGQQFPTPFANPPGKGMSSATLNVIWSLANVLIGYVLLRVSKLTSENKLGLIVFFMAVVCVSVALSITFQ
jgi:hypothetical protein